MYPHRIRLRGPWECEPEGRPPLRMQIPCRWADAGLAGFAGRVRFRRRFGCPTNLDPGERVWLTFGGVEGSVVVTLNGQSLPALADPAGGFEYEITSLLLPRNELLVDVDGPATGGIVGEVALEVRRTAYLRYVSATAIDSRLRVEGEIVGTAERPLELYVIVGRSNVAYGQGVAAPEGKPFALTSEPLALDGQQPIRVDLVDLSTVWYTVERVVDFPVRGQQAGP